MTEIPTIACEACSGLGGFLVLVGRAVAGRRPCPQCSGTGRIPRPPLTPDEIAALPDGARVVWLPAESDRYMAREGVIVRDHIGGKPGVNTWFGGGKERATVLLCYQDGVWLADDGGEGRDG